MQQIKTVIFDLDGTLLNTLEDLKDSVNATLSTYGYPERSLEEVRQFVGNGVARLMELAVPEQLDNEKSKEVLECFKVHYARNCDNKTKPYDGILTLLSSLKNQGYHLAIVSNKFDAAVKDLNQLYFSNYIEVAIGQREGVRKKPYPDTVNIALKELGSCVEEALYIGDSEVDIETAKNAGLKFLSVDWGFRNREELIRSGAQVIVEKPEDIIEYLK
ncbi:HAD family hydrolase [Lachnoclostridium phytofermentans]|uniref:HAD-superfamily hydrolase, subfamily IA, variant 3 n=1 Tax=Lachnoclostridium phytofermentans (strain ATCC 700394 / DSM 18823 / ISDg) TaxID=357809 RepID=A9KQZ1_LACP7|nr:HAD-IA family hydrolase [Lachnoclostridium phytofermentans]ABX43470.1 HAD-superfamily hydrolase, subfamily IA, variant 3 [Lachnoclostridium phytofermentans ISDg]